MIFGNPEVCKLVEIKSYLPTNIIDKDQSGLYTDDELILLRKFRGPVLDRTR